MDVEADDSQAESSSSSAPSSLRTRLRPADTQYLFEAISSLLENEETRLTITEAEFREHLREAMGDKGVIMDDGSIVARLRTAGECAREVEQQEGVVSLLWAQWAHRRDAFTAAQAHRREERKVRLGRLRSPTTRVVVDSEEEFDEVEPVLNLSQLRVTGAAAYAAYSPVRERFATEKASRRKEVARVLRDQRTEARRDQRREELLSSISAFTLPADADIAPSPPSSSSSSSSSITDSISPKRKFNAAGVTEAYTKFLATSAQRTAIQAAEMKAAIDKEAQRAERDAQLTAEYRERKLAEMREFRQAVLEELRAGKENGDPNARSEEKEVGARARGLLSSFIGL